MELGTVIHELELLNNGDRIKRMVEFGRLAKEEQEVSSLITQLWNGNKYEKFLALYSTHGSRNMSMALEAVTSTSEVLRSLALLLIAQLATDEEAIDVALALPSSLQLPFIKSLRRRRHRRAGQGGKQSIMDIIIGRIETSEDILSRTLLKRVLPFSSDTKAQAHLSKVVESFSSSDWTRFIQHHPVIACDHVLPWLESVIDTTWLLEGIVDKLIRRLSQSESMVDRALRLFEKGIPFMDFSRYAAEKLMSKRPEQVVAIILEHKKYIKIRLHKFYRSLSIPSLLRMFDLEVAPFYVPVLHLLSKEQLLETYHHLRPRWVNKTGVLSLDVLPLLPRQYLVTEVRRTLEVTQATNIDIDSIKCASLLPWDEAMALQTGYLKSNDLNIRRAALVSQIRAVKLQKDRIGDALKLLREHRSEPGHVRENCYKALVGLPPGAWKDENLEAMSNILQDALDKADTSPVSIEHLWNVVAKIGIFHSHWAAAKMALIMKERAWFSMIYIPRPGYTSTRTAMAHIVQEIHPVILGWQGKGMIARISEFALALGKNLRYYPELLDLIENLVVDEDSSGLAHSFLHCLVKARPQQTRRLFLSLLDKDPSWCFIFPIAKMITLQETHTLTKYSLLEFKRFEGKFAPKLVHHFNPRLGHKRWTLAQQEITSRSIVAETQKNERLEVNWGVILDGLRELCFTDGAALVGFFDHEKPSVRQLAVTIAAGMDSPADFLQRFRVALDTDTARYAIVALRKILSSTSNSDKLKLLRSIPRSKVTVTKEVIRLVASLGTDEAFHYLMDLSTDNLHIDARITLLKSLVSFHDRAQAWELLMEAAKSSNLSVVRSIVSIQYDGLPRSVNPKLAILFTTLLQRVDPRIQFYTLARLKRDFIPDPTGQLPLAVIELLQSSDHSVPGQAALIVFTLYPKYHSFLYPKEIAKAFADPKSRRHLGIIVSEAYEGLAQNRRDNVATTYAILDALRDSSNEFCEISRSSQVKLALFSLPWPENLDAFKNMIGILTPDCIKSAIRTIDGMERSPGIVLEDFEQHLSGRGESLGTQSREETATQSPNPTAMVVEASEIYRRLGLAALLAMAKRATGWTDDLRKRLELYRKDKSFWVRESAYAVVLPGEGFEIQSPKHQDDWLVVDRPREDN